MDGPAFSFEPPARAPLRVLAALAVALACLLAWPLVDRADAGGQGTATAGAGSQAPAPPAAGGASATLEECVTSAFAEQRAVAFSAEMTAVAGTMRMAMRIDLEERAPGEAEFHAVTAQGIGTWRSSDPKVKVYKYLKQVTNLSAPAAYRGFVRFRWLNAKGHVIRRTDRLTGRCLQPALAAPQGESPPTSGTPSTGASAAAPAA